MGNEYGEMLWWGKERSRIELEESKGFSVCTYFIAKIMCREYSAKKVNNSNPRIWDVKVREKLEISREGKDRERKFRQ